MRFDEAVNYLLSLGHETLAIKLGLDNIERLLAALGHPERAYPAVQIAGTNGKGSTAAMLDGICRAANLRTGLYTSPHLISITERVRIGGHDITRREFARLATRVRAAATELKTRTGALPTFFEQVTAIALLAFREAQVELAILETGLGGRLDATTSARASLLAITPVALDHQEYLGTTLEAIAAEKAAIIRAGASVVVAPQADAARAVILARCRECHVTPRFATEDVRAHDEHAGYSLLATFKTESDVYEHVRMSLRGRHQLTNASVAISLAEVLRERGFPIEREAIIEGLETTRHAGRLELFNGRPDVLLDGAHNAAGARALSDYLDEFAGGKFITLLFGAMRDKELDEIAAALFPVANLLYLTRLTNPRTATLGALRKLASAHPSKSDGAAAFFESPARALRAAERATPRGGIVCVTGSLYLVGEIKRILERRGGLKRGV
ncbi:MAG: dihydrofolate synthase / folylpolyglutamate synthase [Pyrinomonadaceae bacterium]|nr:dihydrofolate synthase / folylpolyglutamate synthase [Pyrinomonadaceae bacterium]